MWNARICLMATTSQTPVSPASPTNTNRRRQPSPDQAPSIQSSVQFMPISEEGRLALLALLSEDDTELMREARKELAEREAKEKADEMEREARRQEAKRKAKEEAVSKKRKLAEEVERKFETGEEIPESEWNTYFSRD